MNYHAMMKEYKRVDYTTKVENEDSHGFVELIFEELINNLKTLTYAMNNGPKISQIKSKSFSQSITSLMILSSSLDFENGEPIASNLYNLYNYCRKTIISSFRNNSTNEINVCLEILSEISDAWKQIK
jgi:flagellar protein FliS